MANGEETKDFAHAVIEPEVFQRALEAWMSYLESKNEIDEVFAKYDWDNSGKLERDQLKGLLTDLNEGDPPDDEEVLTP